MSWFTEEIDRISKSAENYPYIDKGSMQECRVVPKRDLEFLLSKLQKLGEKSYLDNYERCQQVLELREKDCAGHFENCFVGCYEAADRMHKNRLALAFPDFAQAITDRQRGNR